MKLEKLLPQIEVEQFLGNDQAEVIKVVPLDSDRHNENTITWTKSLENPALGSLENCTLICPEGDLGKIENLQRMGVNLIITKNPRRSFLQLLKFFQSERVETGISDSAQVHSSVEIGAECFIGHNVVIEENSVLGKGVSILHNTVIKSGTRIGDNVKIGCNNTIGGVGFGYELLANGEYELIPHIGGVEIGDNVEIGNNTCIDRAVLGNTRLRKNVKVDNLVHIAHGCDIGENSLVIANAMVAGSVKVGRNSWIAPSASILNKLSIGNDSLIGMGSVVLKNVGNDEIVAGNPGKLLKKKDK